MTKKTTEIYEQGSTESFKKLSIQVGLNGLSFCVLDTVGNHIVATDGSFFKVEQTPYLLQKHLKELLEKHKLVGQQFAEVIVVHQNTLFSLVPKDLFEENELANYLKFNTKILANDHIVYDEIDNQDMVNVYVPFTNINNYIFELFGEFEFKHNATVFLQTLLGQKFDLDTHCMVHVYHDAMELMVVSQKKLQLYNQFRYKTKEDFLYYILFTLEQLGLDPEQVKLKLFGGIEEGDPLYEICYSYVKHIVVISPPHPSYLAQEPENSIDFTVLNSL